MYSRLNLSRWFKDILADFIGCISQFGLLWTKADITGCIIKIRPNTDNDILAEILVESRTGKCTGTSVVSVKQETLLFERDGKKIKRIRIQKMRTGQQV